MGRRTVVIIGIVLAGLVAGVIATRRREAREASTSVSTRDERVAVAPRTSQDARRPARASNDFRAAPVDPRIVNVPSDVIAANLRAPLVLSGEVFEASGATPERQGARCRLGVDRTLDSQRCRVVLECGSSRLYGDPIVHETRCEAVGDRLTSLTDDATTRVDRDPSLVYERTTQTMTLRDDRGGIYGEFTLVVHVDDPNVEWESNDVQ